MPLVPVWENHFNNQLGLASMNLQEQKGGDDDETAFFCHWRYPNWHRPLQGYLDGKPATLAAHTLLPPPTKGITPDDASSHTFRRVRGVNLPPTASLTPVELVGGTCPTLCLQLASEKSSEAWELFAWPPRHSNQVP
ncbi:hypothetical protein V2G26_000756 [Clonostachys chloroleuca]